MVKTALLISMASVGLALSAPAFADDCTDSGDCAMAPRNIDAATAIAAAGPFVALAWVYFSRRRDGAAVGAALVPPTTDEIAGTLAAVKEEFERLQEELREQAVNEHRKLDEFLKDYDEKWREGMFALEDYLQEYENLLPGIQKIWEQMGSREDARRIAEAVDTAIMAAQIGVGLVGSTAGTAAREAMAVARQAGTRAEAEAVRRAAREALGAEVRGLQTADALAAQAARQAAQRAAAQAERAAAQAAERAAARKAEEAALDQAMDRQIAEMAARRAKAEQEVIDEIRSINPTGHQDNCVWCSQAVEEGMAGRGSIIAIPSRAPAGDIRWLENLYGRQFARMGDGASGKAALDRLLAQNPGARGVVRVQWKDESFGHAFNAVNRDGVVLYPDGQTGAMMNAWDDAAEVLFLRTN